MLRNDEIRIRHMLDAAREAIDFSTDKSREDLDADRKLVLSLIKDIEIIGEAARGVSQEFRRADTTIPWQDIIAMRNRLIHAYFDVDLDRVWDTIVFDLPPLIEALEDLIRE